MCRAKMFRFLLGSNVRYKIEMRHRGIVSARLGILKGGASRSESRYMIAGGNHTTTKGFGARERDTQ